MAIYNVRATVEYDAEIEADTPEEAIADMKWMALENGQLSPTQTTVEVMD